MARVQIAVATLSGNSLRQTVHTHWAYVHQAAELVAALLRVARVTAGLAESNGSLLPGLWLTSLISSGTLCSVIEYGLPLPFYVLEKGVLNLDHGGTLFIRGEDFNKISISRLIGLEGQCNLSSCWQSVMLDCCSYKLLWTVTRIARCSQHCASSLANDQRRLCHADHKISTNGNQSVVINSDFVLSDFYFDI